MKTEELMERRNNLTKQRDAIQKEIVSLWQQMQQAVLEEVKSLGIFDAVWKYVDDISNYEDRRESLYLSDGLVTPARELFNKYNVQVLNLGDGVRLILGYSNIHINFGYKTDIRKFVKEYNLKIDFSALDKQLEEVKKKKELFY